MKVYTVYILTNMRRGTLYVGMTNNLQRRIMEHRRCNVVGGFTNKYKLKRLVYVETFERAYVAITREKRLKSWNRQWKIDLIEKHNPEWNDLYKVIFGPEAEDFMDPRSSLG